MEVWVREIFEEYIERIVDVLASESLRVLKIQKGI